MSKRLHEFDILRAFAALSVIAIHVTASYVTDNRLGAVWNETMRYAVPLFILLSGLVLMYVDLQRKPDSYFLFQRKRFGKIFMPYILWTIFYIYFTARQVWRTEGWLGVKRIADTLPNHFWNGDGEYHLYFLIITLQLYLLYPLLRLWMRKSPLSLMTVSLLVTAYGQTMQDLNKPVWAFDLFTNWIFYFVLGMYLITKRTWLEKQVAKRSLPLGLVWVASLVFLIWEGRHTHTSYTSLKPTVMLYALTSFFFFYSVGFKLKEKHNRVSRIIDWISTQSFFIFLVHPFLLSLLYLFGEKIKKTFWDGTLGMISIYLCTVLLACAVTYGVSKIPFNSLIGGVYSGRKKQANRLERPAPSNLNG